MTLQIVRAETPQQRKEFIEFPYRLHKDDPKWIAPLRMQIKEQFDEKHHPFLRRARTQLLLAERDGKTVGRITAHHDPAQNSKTGMFGFFECTNDPEAAAGLLDAAKAWLKEEGRSRIQGPYSWTTHEPVGVLVDGFDDPPMLMMNHNPNYYDPLLRSTGLEKKKDLWAYRFDVDNMPQQVIDAYKATEAEPRLTIRPVDLKEFEAELGIVVSIYNEAWKDNWGFSPITQRELRATAKGLKPIVDPELVLIAELDGEPAGMAVAVPNLNEAITGLNGRLLPFGWARLLWRLKVQGTKTARLMLMGIRPEHRGEWSRAILMGLYGRLHEVGKRKGLQWGELSWTLEDNDAVNKSIQRTGSKHYKTYRIYEAPV